MTLKSRFEELRKETQDSELIAVSKYASCEQIEKLYYLGHRDFGENKVQALLEKVEYFNERSLHDIRWHFIGRIQSNKISKLITISTLASLHSVDRMSLLKKLLERDSEMLKPLDIFLQVNTSGEKEKAGFENFEEIQRAIEEIRQTNLKNITLKGLMTMGAIRTENYEQEAKKCFKKLSDWAGKLEGLAGKKLALSMGMSGDYPLALKCGATHLRVGSKLFQDQ